MTQTSQRGDILIANEESLYAELWTSLASLLRSYTAAHGLHQGIEAAIDADAHRITARNGKRWLKLERNNNAATWTRENGTSGEFELTESGRLKSVIPRSRNRDLGHPIHEEEMDMAAEAWARELINGDTTR